jgi:hypothetical protein
MAVEAINRAQPFVCLPCSNEKWREFGEDVTEASPTVHSSTKPTTVFSRI